MIEQSVSLAFIQYIIYVSTPHHPKLWVSVNTIVIDLCQITELRNMQLKVEILHNLKEFDRLFGF